MKQNSFVRAISVGVFLLTAVQALGSHCSATKKYSESGEYIGCQVKSQDGRESFHDPKGLTPVGCDTLCSSSKDFLSFNDLSEYDLFEDVLNFGKEPSAPPPPRDEEIEAAVSKKHVITQDNFDSAMQMIHDRPAGEYLSEKLTSKLRKFVGKELSADEWVSEVQAAYIEILSGFPKPTQRVMLMSHPMEVIAMASIWAIPSGDSSFDSDELN